MNAIAQAHRHGLVDRFLARFGGRGLPKVIENPPAERVHELGRGRTPRLYGMSQGGAVQGRIEENYL